MTEAVESDMKPTLRWIGDSVVAIRLGKRHLIWFGPLAGSGVFVGLWLLYAREIQAIELSPAHLYQQVALLTVGIVVGSRLYALGTDLPTLIRAPREALLKTGFAFQGGLLGVVAATAVFARLRGISWTLLADVLALSAPVAHAIGRLACLSYGCCHGRATMVPFAIVYENPLAKACWDAGLRGRPIHPTQLYDLLSNVSFYVCLSLLLPGSRVPQGGCAALFLVLTGASRFVQEFLRGEPAPQYRGLKVYQWFCVLQVVLGVVLYLFVAASPATPFARSPFTPALLIRAAAQWPVFLVAGLSCAAAFGIHGAGLGSFSDCRSAAPGPSESMRPGSSQRRG